jgi:hypothetical protein
MKKSSLNGAFPVAGSTVERYEREANASFFNASGSGFENDDPNFYASGGAVSSQEPYRVQVENKGGAAETAILFGAFKYLNVSRFGSGANTDVTMGVGGVSYAQLLQQSATEPFEVVLTRVECSNATQLQQSFNLWTQDASGTAQSRPLTTSSYKSPQQFQNNMIDINQNYRIDGSTWLEYPVAAGQVVTISFFVSGKVNIAKPLNGQAPIQEFSAQRLRTFRS